MDVFLMNMLFHLAVTSAYKQQGTSSQLNTALSIFAQANRTIVSVPFRDRKTIQTTVSALPAHPCNQQTFFNHLRARNHWNKRQHEPTFLLKPFYQSPEQRCFVTDRRKVDLSSKHTFIHPQKKTIPNSIIQFLYPILTKTEFEIAGWNQHPSRIFSRCNYFHVSCT